MHTKRQHYLIGIMSGTSCDGIDVAIIRADNYRLIHFSEYPMPAELREPILRIAEPGFDEIDTLGHLDRALGIAFAQAALATLKNQGLSTHHILAIGNHGQTIRHRPKGISGTYPFTLQIGCAATIAEQTGITVVSDFRKRDIAANGGGAPLVPFAHQKIFQVNDTATAILNIGGIANITMFNTDHDIQGFDTGPGNIIMDALMLQLTDGRHAYDRGGALAATGNVCDSLLEKLLQHPFIMQSVPKSTGREVFGQNMVDQILTWPKLSDADRMATACALTVQSIVANIAFLNSTPKRWIVCGGGAFNSHLMQCLRETLDSAEVCDSSEYGLPAEAVEAISFAILARYTLLGGKNILPEVTGAENAVCGGQITPGNNWGYVLEWVRENALD